MTDESPVVPEVNASDDDELIFSDDCSSNHVCCNVADLGTLQLFDEDEEMYPADFGSENRATTAFVDEIIQPVAEVEAGIGDVESDKSDWDIVSQ